MRLERARHLVPHDVVDACEVGGRERLVHQPAERVGHHVPAETEDVERHDHGDDGIELPVAGEPGGAQADQHAYGGEHVAPQVRRAGDERRRDVALAEAMQVPGGGAVGDGGDGGQREPEAE